MKIGTAARQQHEAAPYVFDRIFTRTAAPIQAEAQDLHIQATALQAELAQMSRDHGETLKQARLDGFAAGLAEARSEIAEALLVAETVIGQRLAGLSDRFAETEARMAVVASEVALAAGSILAAEALDADPTRAIEHAIGRVLGQTGYREALRVHVAPGLLAAVELLVVARSTHERRRLEVSVHADPGLRPGDVNILWDRGGLSLDAAARMAAVRAALGLVPA